MGQKHILIDHLSPLHFLKIGKTENDAAAKVLLQVRQLCSEIAHVNRP